MSGISEKIKSLQWHNFIYIALIAAMVIGSDGCKTSGKLTRKERKAQIEAAKKQLNDIINGTTTKTLEQQERVVSEIINKNYNDPELNQLIIKAQQKLKSESSEIEKKKAERIDMARSKLMDLLLNRENRSADELEKELGGIKSDIKDLNSSELNDLVLRLEKKIDDMRGSSSANVPLKMQLDNNFQGIATASKSGNSSQMAALVNSTLKLFSGDDVPVLIIISREGSIVDYDKPTTIRRYLDFLKDQKSNRNAVDSYQLDANGKIKELDLIKK
ncbi:MAG: hypothetical protein NTX61_18955 [Bacteroidetes bacterium]|nr:hypothetical protein [Bacteroidota bacterium]